MPTPAQVANRAQPKPTERHYRATVTAVGPPYTVQLDSGSTVVTAIGPAGLNVNDRVLVVATEQGNYIVSTPSIGAPARMIQTGGPVTCHLSNATGGTFVVNFPTPFPATPTVMVNMTNTDGNSTVFRPRAVNIGTGAFTIFIFGGTAPIFIDLYVIWLAVLV